LVGCALGWLHCRGEYWLWILSWRWLCILPVHLLRWSLHLSIGSLHLRLRPLHLELRTLHLHWHLQPVHLWWLNELVRLQEARPNVAFGGLSMEWHLSLAILLHFLELVFNNNCLIDHVLEVCVVCVEQLELNVIIQSIQEHVLFLLISVDVVRGIP
jgi:hypothetical protein